MHLYPCVLQGSRSWAVPEAATVFLSRDPSTSSCSAALEGHLMLLALKEGATALRTAFQCSSVCPVRMLVPPRNWVGHQQQAGTSGSHRVMKYMHPLKRAHSTTKHCLMATFDSSTQSTDHGCLFQDQVYAHSEPCYIAWGGNSVKWLLACAGPGHHRVQEAVLEAQLVQQPATEDLSSQNWVCKHHHLHQSHSVLHARHLISATCTSTLYVMTSLKGARSNPKVASGK